jgi:hypothetical protein
MWNSALVRALRGPLMLITLGILGLLDVQNVARLTLTWPVLIIAYGLLRLVEYQFRPMPPALGGGKL